MPTSKPKNRIKPTPTLTHCLQCDLRYVTGIPSEDDEHRVQHRRWKKAVRAFGTVRTHGELEHFKREGWALIWSDADLAERLRGAEMVMRAHFECSVWSAAMQKRRHPPLEVYASAWRVKVMPADIQRALDDKYGCKPTPKMPFYTTLWGRPPSWAQQKQAQPTEGPQTPLQSTGLCPGIEVKATK